MPASRGLLTVVSPGRTGRGTPAVTGGAGSVSGSGTGKGLIGQTPPHRRPPRVGTGIGQKASRPPPEFPDPPDGPDVAPPTPLTLPTPQPGRSRDAVTQPLLPGGRTPRARLPPVPDPPRISDGG